jgi:hypothetical protein
MRSTLAVTALTVAVATPLLVGTPAPAATRTQARFDDTRIFTPDNPPGSATTSLPGCATATTVDQRGQLVGTPIKGIFTALRDFQCGGGTGFVVRLRASFANEGSSGTWSIVEGYGDLAGLSGSGKLVGEPVEGGIIDHYNGWVTVH